MDSKAQLNLIQCYTFLIFNLFSLLAVALVYIGNQVLNGGHSYATTHLNSTQIYFYNCY